MTINDFYSKTLTDFTTSVIMGEDIKELIQSYGANEDFISIVVEMLKDSGSPYKIDKVLEAWEEIKETE